ncbi:MAG: MBOAT family protein [Rhizobiales bacterium]|nr:MBOAT family protein [Hyphomicrobiales bacterium]NRB13893.1 MBOAT family protein [Hyphomicrobiales bacterium]
MLFNSLEFIYLFMPLVLVVFYCLKYYHWENATIWWLIIASLSFYAWWSPPHLVLLIGSVIFNFLIHKLILRSYSLVILTFGIIINLSLLGYFKYADFLIGNFNLVTGDDVPALQIILPLAISFFTFQQISFLLDTHNRKITKCDFSKYCLFVVFFPQLIAGPIVLQKHTINQFNISHFYRKIFANFSVGITLFIIGLFKKIVIADSMSPIVGGVFSLAEAGEPVPFAAAWMGSIAYTFQIYFDFSGYCDMALGLARMFGIRLPINFNSPYKAINIVDFWRRWHITLSLFLRNYLYFPLGGNRHGIARRYLNLTITMVLGGLWHGASWNFVFWGFLHGLFLTINHAWNFFIPKDNFMPNFIAKCLSHSVTMFGVIIAWVFFRAESFSAAQAILKGMFGYEEVYQYKLWENIYAENLYFWYFAPAIAAIIYLTPNAAELARKYRPAIEFSYNFTRLTWLTRSIFNFLAWRPTLIWGVAFGVLGLASLMQVYRLDELTEFIYFNF